jgi:hypothetical protein
MSRAIAIPQKTVGRKILANPEPRTPSTPWATDPFATNPEQDPQTEQSATK